MTALENFSFVLPGELAAMAYPHAPGAIDDLRQLGFRSLVTLSRRAPPRGVVGPLIHLHCPLADFTRIPALDLHRVVAFLERAPRPAAIHGEGGVGRTGVALACRLVGLGRTADEAVAEVRRARPGSIDDPELEASVDDYASFRGLLDMGPAGRGAGAPFNFAPASAMDRIVHGAERHRFHVGWEIAPPSRDDDVPPTSGRYPTDLPLDAWLGFMARQGIREVICLLDEASLASFSSPVLARCRREFLRVTHVPLADHAVPSGDALREVLAALHRAEAGDAPAVVHCDAGVGRTGVVLAAWLRARHGAGVDPAIEAVRTHAKLFGAARNPLEAGDDVRRVLESIRPR